ncbi:hypothetical protein CFC21_098785 [Triticum aestivum]|uniref:F-box domain-containing protein n=3 Tax=Triticum TaxID=4564 RepID=A0A9R0ZHM0_TRITD|nr:F-box protein PP2-B10-like [Triticum aestivum]KAF7096901.1 hypothetical protein CFC21_098785 [Triticum aestivum]VAI77834.1 unnamed protein product [Triticum turgidum subsp. durum]
MDTASTATAEEEVTRLEDLPESCLAHVLALTSPRDACRCAAVSPSFREAAESDAVWDRFLPPDYRAVLLRCCSGRPPPLSSKKDAYLRLSDGAVLVDGGDTAVWLARGSGAKCVALSARKLSLPWDDGEFSWRWTPHPRSRFAEVAQLVHCTGLDIYGRLPAAALTPATDYAAYLVFDVADEGHRGLSFPDQETTVAVGGRAASRHAVCLRPDDDEARKFRGVARADGGDDGVRRPALRDDRWSEIEMGRLRIDDAMAVKEEEVMVSFEVLEWYPKRGLIVEAVEFRPV